MKAAINGIGVIGGFGCGTGDLLKSLSSGVAPAHLNSDYYPVYKADISYLNTVIPKRALRRIDHFSQLALAGIYLAIDDAGLESLDKPSTGLIICSGYGSAKTTFSFLDSIFDDGDACASPTLFSNSVHNAAAGHISIVLGLEGPTSTISQFDMSVPSALLTALQWLEEDRVDHIMFGAVDEYCDVMGYSYQRYYGQAENVTMAPLVAGQQSAIPGEGAVFFLLSKKESTKGYGSISSVKTGNIPDQDIVFPEDSFYILNADGHKKIDKNYPDLIPDGSLASCYTPLYGSMPVGTAFDMAAGALSFNEGKLFSSPESVGSLDKSRILKEACINEYSKITCVKVSRQDEFSAITLSSE